MNKGSLNSNRARGFRFHVVALCLCVIPWLSSRILIFCLAVVPQEHDKNAECG